MKIYRLFALAAFVMAVAAGGAGLVQAAPASSLLQAGASVRALENPAAGAQPVEKAYWYYRRYHYRRYYYRPYWRRHYYHRYYHHYYYHPHYYYHRYYYHPYYHHYWHRYYW
jgi:hypothetical protein